MSIKKEYQNSHSIEYEYSHYRQYEFSPRSGVRFYTHRAMTFRTPLVYKIYLHCGVNFHPLSMSIFILLPAFNFICHSSMKFYTIDSTVLSIPVVAVT
jgi:hypothetical protein